MRKLLAILIMAFAALHAHAAVVTMQVTIGASNTKVLAVGAHQQCRWIVFQNNAAHSIRIGDTNITTSRGILIQPSGSFYVGPDAAGSARDLGGWYINGTNGDVVDVVFDDGQ